MSSKRKPKVIDRRTFLRQSLAGGLTIGFSLGGAKLLARTATSLGGSLQDDPSWSPDIFLSLAADGQLTIIAHRSEMGTGIGTALPMVLADEMEADWERVQIVQGDADSRYGSQNTDGSRSIRNFYDRMRQAGALARTMLVAAAAETWRVSADSCYAEKHKIVHKPSGKRLSYGELTGLAATQTPPQAESLQLKPASERRYVGKDIPIRDMHDILHGRAQFGLDIRLPDMLVAVIARPPVLGGAPKEWDQDAALAVSGVQAVVAMPTPSAPFVFQALGGIAVLAKDTWSALRGRDALACTWSDGEHAVFDSGQQQEELRGNVAQPGRKVRRKGDADSLLKNDGEHLQADYEAPHLAHAPMETPCATARMTEDGVEVWMPTQDPQSAQQAIAGALKLTPQQVTVHVTLLGGGFGRKSKPDYGVEAALLAQHTGKAVQVLWTREDDLRHGYYHAASAMSFAASLGKDGLPTAWRQRSAFTPIGFTFNPAARDGSDGELSLGFTDMPFDVPNLSVENGPSTPHVRIGWLRSVCNVFHAFGVSSFADELAAANDADPLQYLLRLIGEPRHIGVDELGAGYGNYGASLEQHPVDTGRLADVLRKVGELGDWSTRRKSLAGSRKPWRGLGVAAHRSFLGYVANIVEVEVSETGALRIPRVDVVVDCGLAIHPDRVRAQMEGAVVFGTSLTRFGAISAEEGRIVEGNFDTYQIARNLEAPKQIHVHLVPSEADPSGVGEIGVPPFAPALCNAIFAATGKRIRRLPLQGQDLKPA